MLRIIAASNGLYTDLGLTKIKFPGGEIHVTLNPYMRVNEISIQAHLDSSDAIMELLMATDALKRAYPDAAVTLDMPYVPYARQDRVNEPGEAHSIKVFCNLINAQGYKQVRIQDPHSDVTTALLDRVVVEDPRSIIEAVIDMIGVRHGVKCALVSPDAGARKRVLSFAKRFKTYVVFADKVRDTRTGKITGTEIHGAMPDKPLLIVDDICDGGRTFIELAKAIRQREVEEGQTDEGKIKRPLYLYVTHGIFSKGLDPLLAEFNAVLTRNNWTDDKRAVTVYP